MPIRPPRAHAQGQPKPSRPRTVCQTIGCPRLADPVTRYCPDHQGHARVHPTGKRLSSSARGYDAWWKTYTKAYLAAHPHCVYCQRRGVVTRSACVDHIVAPCGDRALFRDPRNHAASCISCNSAKAVAQEGAGWRWRR